MVHVVVVGAGVKGLHVARELVRAGVDKVSKGEVTCIAGCPHRHPLLPPATCWTPSSHTVLMVHRALCHCGVQVTVLESSDRVGGKVLTARRPGHAMVELGAMRLLESQARVIGLLEDLGLSTAPYIEDNPRAPFVLGLGFGPGLPPAAKATESRRGTVATLTVGELVAAGLVVPDTAGRSGLAVGASFADVVVQAFQEVSPGSAATELTVHEFLSESDGLVESERALRAVALKVTVIWRARQSTRASICLGRRP
jgi:hypothetical protein